MKRKVIRLEVDTTLTNKQLKVKELWEAFGVKIIQVEVNEIRKGEK